MGLKKVNKNCKMCGNLMENVDSSRLYCKECADLRNKNSIHSYKKRTRKSISDNKKEKYIQNFNKIVKESFHLTPLGFNSISEINYNSYQNLFKMKWIEIVKYFNKYDELLEYIIDEYDKFINETGKQAFRLFTDTHEYIGIQMLKTIGFDYIRNIVGVNKKRNTLEDCKNDFNRLIEIYGRVPLYSEFFENSSVSLSSYKCHLGIKDNTGKVYDKIVRYFVTEKMYKQYLDERYEHKSNVGKENHQGNKYTDEELEEEFHKTIKFYEDKYNTFPTWRLFNKISKIEISVYRHRFNKTWKEICKMYGYEVKEKFKSEKIALEIVSEIIGEDFIPQKTFDWLKGFKGFPLFCDGYFPEHKLVVEFDGNQHRYPIEWFGGMKAFHEIKTNDKYKEVLIPKNGLKLIRISSEENWHDNEYIKNKLIKNGINIS